MTGPAKSKEAAHIPEETAAVHDGGAIHTQKIESETHHGGSGMSQGSASSSQQADTSAPPSGSQSTDNVFNSNNLMILIIIGGVVYVAGERGLLPAACLKFWKQAPRKYRPVGASERGGADSDGDDEGDDPTARRRMLELSSFSPRKRNQAHPSGGGPSQPAGRSAAVGDYGSSADQANTSSFPSFSAPGAGN